jgi:hypothetical protein
MLLSTSSAGLVAFLAGSIGGGGLITAVLLCVLVVAAALWTMTAKRVKGDVPCFKTMKVIDGTPSEIFLYLMNVKNYPMYAHMYILRHCHVDVVITIVLACLCGDRWDASIEKADVVHTIDDHSDIIHIVYRSAWMWPV